MESIKQTSCSKLAPSPRFTPLPNSGCSTASASCSPLILHSREPDRKGRAPLDHAADWNQGTAAELLLQHGAILTPAVAAALGRRDDLKRFLATIPNSFAQATSSLERASRVNCRPSNICSPTALTRTTRFRPCHAAAQRRDVDGAAGIRRLDRAAPQVRRRLNLCPSRSHAAPGARAARNDAVVDALIALGVIK